MLINTYMRLYELFHIHEANYQAQSFFKDDDTAVKEVLRRGEAVASFMYKSCQPWLKSSNNGEAMLYRGFTKSLQNMAFTKAVRKNRNPLSSSQDEHDAFNALIKLGKKKANRSNALFCTGDKYMASEYGDEYVVIPIGAFNYTWHTHYADWFDNIPYYEILQTKLPKEKKKTKAEIAAEKEQTAKEYEQKKKTATASVQNTTKYLNQFFSEYGINVTKNSYTGIRNTLFYMFEGYAKNGSMWGGTPSNPFPNINKNAPTVSDWGRSVLIKSKPLKDLYFGPLQSASKEKKAEIRKKLLTCKNKLNAYVKGHVWLKNNKSLEEYAERKREAELEKLLYDYDDATRWTPSMPLSKLDRDNNSLKKFLKGLKGDDGTLIEATESGNEVMISCSKTLAIDPNFYGIVVLPILRGKKPSVDTYLANKLLQGHENKGNDW